MVFSSGILSIIIGTVIGIMNYITASNNLMPNKYLYTSINLITNILRSIPFIILMVAAIPFTRFIVGTSIGTSAAIVPLTLAATPFYARVTTNALNNISSTLLETSVAFGASTWHVIIHILFGETRPDLIRGCTLMLINLIGYSAMAGAIGGGGLGDIAIRYGYERFDMHAMFLTVTILIIIVQLIQYLGNAIEKHYMH